MIGKLGEPAPAPETPAPHDPTPLTVALHHLIGVLPPGKRGQQSHHRRDDNEREAHSGDLFALRPGNAAEQARHRPRKERAPSRHSHYLGQSQRQNDKTHGR